MKCVIFCCFLVFYAFAIVLADIRHIQQNAFNIIETYTKNTDAEMTSLSIMKGKDTTDCSNTYVSSVRGAKNLFYKDLGRCIRKEEAQASVCFGESIAACEAAVDRIVKITRKCINDK